MTVWGIIGFVLFVVLFGLSCFGLGVLVGCAMEKSRGVKAKVKPSYRGWESEPDYGDPYRDALEKKNNEC